MFRDIVIPNNNEAEFAMLSSKLGIKKLYFLYNQDNYNKEKIQKKIGLVQNNVNIDLEIGLIVNNKNINNALQHSKLLVVKSSDNDRFFIESKKISMIYGFEEFYKKDHIHQRASGLNHVICELAERNNVTIGISYGLLLNNNKLTPLFIGRIIQNIRLCQKYKVKTAIASFSESPFGMRSFHDLVSLFTIFGVDSKKIKISLTNL